MSVPHLCHGGAVVQPARLQSVGVEEADGKHVLARPRRGGHWLPALALHHLADQFLARAKVGLIFISKF